MTSSKASPSLEDVLEGILRGHGPMRARELYNRQHRTDHRSTVTTALRRDPRFTSIKAGTRTYWMLTIDG